MAEKMKNTKHPELPITIDNLYLKNRQLTETMVGKCKAQLYIDKSKDL